jgi:hypothetical protein
VALVVVVVAICTFFIVVPVGLFLLWTHLMKSDLVKAWERVARRMGGHLAQGNDLGGSRVLCPKTYGSVSLVHVVAHGASPHHHAAGPHTHAVASLRPTGPPFMVGAALPLLVVAHELMHVPAWRGIAGLERVPRDAWIVVEGHAVNIVMPGVVTDERQLEEMLTLADQLAQRALQGHSIVVSQPQGQPHEPRLRLAALAG